MGDIFPAGACLGTLSPREFGDSLVPAGGWGDDPFGREGGREKIRKKIGRSPLSLRVLPPCPPFPSPSPPLPDFFSFICGDSLIFLSGRFLVGWLVNVSAKLPYSLLPLVVPPTILICIRFRQNGRRLFVVAGDFAVYPFRDIDNQHNRES